MQKENLDKIDIINDTPNELKKETPLDIKPKKVWKRICSGCGKELTYTQQDNWHTANKNKSKCNKHCGKLKVEKIKSKKIPYWKKIPSDKIENGIPYWKKECIQCKSIYFLKHYPKYIKNLNKPCRKCYCDNRKVNLEDLTRKCPKCCNIITYGSRQSKDRAEKNGRPCRMCYFKYRIIGEVWRENISKGTKKYMNSIPPKERKELSRKMRVGMIKHIEENNGGCHPMVSKKACIFIDNFSYAYGYNFQHGLNGGEYKINELGYFVDGYDKERNVVIEYDEIHHFNVDGTLKQKDIIRMNDIKEILNCKFIRYNEKLNEIKEY